MTSATLGIQRSSFSVSFFWAQKRKKPDVGRVKPRIIESAREVEQGSLPSHPVKRYSALGGNEVLPQA